MAKLAINSLVEAERTADSVKVKITPREIQQNGQQPRASSRILAHDMLREIHDHNTCVYCEDKNPCHQGRASLIIRVLLILTICIFKPPEGGSWSNNLLHIELEKALVEGCNHDRLTTNELSQLTFSFNKCRERGKTRESLDDKMRATSMHRAKITDDDVEALFTVYSTMCQTSPNHVSKNKASGKHRKRKSSPKGGHTATAAWPEEEEEEEEDAEVFHDVPEEEDNDGFVYFGSSRSHSGVSQDGPSKLIEYPLDVPLPFGLQQVMNYKCWSAVARMRWGSSAPSAPLRPGDPR